jgi:NarL family two-component system response regulator LiaR
LAKQTGKRGIESVKSSNPIRVVIVDDYLMVRRGIATFLSVFEDLELVGEASNGESAIRICSQVQPDVVLMDLVMPGMDGTVAIQTIRQQIPNIKVIALTSYKDEELVLDAVQAGAISYLLKDVTAEELAQAIRAAHAGRASLATEAAVALIHAANQPAPLGHDLTNRELAVLSLMVDGLSNPQIAKKLVVGPSTIKTHVSSILSKLGVASRSEAVALAVRNHLVK